MMFIYNHTLDDKTIEFEYSMKENDSIMTQVFNMYNPDIEIEQ